MNIEVITEDDLNAELQKVYETLKPKLLGFCIGVAGQPCGRRIYDDEIGAVELEVDRITKKKQGVIGECCYSKLFGTPWSKQANAAETAAQSAGGKKSKALNNPFIRLPGNKSFGQGRKAGSASPRKEVKHYGK